MEFIIDTADLKAIRRIVEFFPVTGVTTNPTIISKEKTDFKQLVLALREAVGPDKQVHVQTTCEKAEEIVREAEELQALAASSQLLSSVDGLYMTLFIALPMTEWMYKMFTKNNKNYKDGQPIKKNA